MTIRICVVFHSGYGHTTRQAQAVLEGCLQVADAAAELLPVDELFDTQAAAWSKLDSADAIVLGCPTYMGSPSADMKRFLELTSSRWMEQKWADKLAAGFTNSGSQNGDKQNTLIDLATFAAQHGMVWINLNVPPGNNHSGGSDADLNRLGSSLGAMAQSNVDAAPDVAPGKADLDTARRLGQRVAQCALRWAG
jgi:NAD(P)H dehydrogenase (quinone)